MAPPREVGELYRCCGLAAETLSRLHPGDVIVVRTSAGIFVDRGPNDSIGTRTRTSPFRQRLLSLSYLDLTSYVVFYIVIQYRYDFRLKKLRSLDAINHPIQ